LTITGLGFGVKRCMCGFDGPWVQEFGFKCLGLRVTNLGFKGSDLGFRVQSLGFRV